MKKVLFGAFLVTLVAATSARAQTTVQAQGDRTVHLNIGGGFTKPLSDISDRFDTGGNFVIGVIFEPTETIGLQGEYSYNGLSGKDITLPIALVRGAAFDRNAVLESHSNMQYFDFNVIAQSVGWAKAYAIGGPGMYYRSVSLTTDTLGFTTFCDPFFFACFPEVTEVERVVGDRNGWDFGMNIGGGVTFNLKDRAEFYVETRWHYIWGPEFTDVGGVVRNANGQYLPVTFGFRF